MIGTPYDFQHVSHAGINNDNTCTVSNVSEDKELLNLFSVVGLDQTKLADDNTRKFVYDFIDKHGGIEEAKAADRRYSTKRTMSHNLGNRIASAPTPPPPRVTASTGSINPPHSRVTASTGSINPPPPPRALPPVPPERLSFIHPSPPVNRHYQADRYVVDDGPLPPPPKSLGLPPPPPPSRTLPSPPSPSSKSNIRAPSPPPPTTKYGLSSSALSSYTIPPPPPSMSKGNIPAPSPPPPPSMSKGNIPAPPPPPPPSMSRGNIPTPPPPPPPPPSGRGPPEPPPPKGGVLGGPRPAVDPHAALLEHIRKGSGTLKKAEQSSPPPPSTDSRTQLLEDIKSRAFKLHKVEVEEVEMSEEESLGLEGIALDLHRALKERAQFIQPGDDEEDSSDDDEDDEWDDDGF
ncbi:formin-like protein 3 [Homarus americanus]|nr:formin-like protein 3 [Homarus americanus]